MYAIRSYYDTTDPELILEKWDHLVDIVINGGYGVITSYSIHYTKLYDYDMFLGTSTGSLLIPHLAVNDIPKVYDIFTNVNQSTIFSINPFIQRKKDNRNNFV